jgi:queuine tRNA-ribosyltransferase subunit QTRTD1
MESPRLPIFALSVPPRIDSAVIDNNEARLGSLQLPGRKVIETPNFFAITSRGVIPHMTPDVISDYTRFNGVHLALEDCKLNGRCQE